MFLNRSPREHFEDRQGLGGGHQDPGGRRCLVARAVGRCGPERRHHHRPAERGRQGRSHQPGGSQPRGPSDADQCRQGCRLGPVRPDAVDQGCFRKEHPRPSHAPTQRFSQGNQHYFLIQQELDRNTQPLFNI